MMSDITAQRDRLTHILVVHFDMFRDKAEAAADLYLHDQVVSAELALQSLAAPQAAEPAGEVQRWTHRPDYFETPTRSHILSDNSKGAWVRYVDHQHALAAALAEVDRLTRERDEYKRTAQADSGNIVSWLITRAEAAETRATAAEALEPAIRAFMPLAQVAFLWKESKPPEAEVQRYRDTYHNVCRALSTLPESSAPEVKA